MIVTLRKECHSKNDGEYAMQDDKSVPYNDEHVISPSARIQNILEYLADLWKSSHIPSNEDLKRIAEFVVLLPEAYKSTALTTLAEHFVNSIGLHILDLMATYQQKAEQEGISLGRPSAIASIAASENASVKLVSATTSHAERKGRTSSCKPEMTTRSSTRSFR